MCVPALNSINTRSIKGSGRLLAALVLLSLFQTGLSAQRLTGQLEFKDRPDLILLLDTRGGDHMVIDSTAVDRKGRFAFSQQRYPAGFYQLAINDTDRVDIILVPNEYDVRLGFTGRPLQEHIRIERSDENQRLWEYKMTSRQSHARLASIRQQRSGIDRKDEAAHHRLDSTEAVIRQQQFEVLEKLLEQDTTSYFRHVVKADRRISAAAQHGPTAIRMTMDWTDGRLLRSSVYSKAVMEWMQTAPPELPDGFISAVDSLLKWTVPAPEAWQHTRSLLLRLFDRHGPDFVSQYLVDRYVVGPDALIPPDDLLLNIIADQLKVAVGARAPEVMLPDPITGDTLLLYDILPKNRLVAVFFYSSTCEHCHEQMPHLDEMNSRWGGRGFDVIGIALDGSLEEFQQTLEEKRPSWRAFSELIGWGSPAAKAFHVKATPTFFLLDHNGTIVAKPFEHQELQAELERLLN